MKLRLSNRGILTMLAAAVLAAILCLTILPGASLQALAQEKGAARLVVDGQEHAFSVAPVMIGESLLVPMSDIFKTLGADVTWSQERKEAEAVKLGTSIIIKADSRTAFVNNRVVELPQSAVIIEGRMMVPLLFVSESFGAAAEWNAGTNTVTIKMPEKKEEKKLSYADAIKQGIQKSFAWQSAQISAEKATNRNQDFALTLGEYALPSIRAKEGLKLADKWGEMQLALTADQAGISIESSMDTVSLKLEKQKNLKEKIEFLERKLKTERLKYDYGMLSLSALQDVEGALFSAKQNLVVLEKELDAAYTDLNYALGYPESQRDLPEYDLKYVPLPQIDLEKKIKDDTSGDPYLWFASQQRELAQFALTTYEYNAESQSWTLTKLDLSSANLNAANTEKALAKTIRSRYDQLRLLEENLESLKITLDQTKRNVNVARLQFDIGMITKIQLEEARMNVCDLEVQIHELQLKHKQLTEIFEKPYLAPDYVSGSGQSAS